LFDFLGIIVAAALVNNVALVQFLGVSAFYSGSNQLQSAYELGLLNFLALLLTTTISLLLYRWILLPLNLEILSLLVFINVSFGVAFLLMKVVTDHYPLSLRRQELSIFLLAGNSAVIGVSLQTSTSIMPIVHAVGYNLGTALGFSFVLIGFAALRQRLSYADIPESFRGAPIHFVSAAIISMVLLGFAGLV